MRPFCQKFSGENCSQSSKMIDHSGLSLSPVEVFRISKETRRLNVKEHWFTCSVITQNTQQFGPVIFHLVWEVLLNQLPVTYFSTAQSFSHIAQSTQTILPWSVQNFITILQLKWILWKHNLHEISVQVSEGHSILQQPPGLNVINNIPTLFQTIAWRRPGDKPLSETMMILVANAYMRHSASMS